MKIFVTGINGKMGRVLCERAEELGIEVVGGMDAIPHPAIPTFESVSDVNVTADAVIDFSRPQLLDSVTELCKRFHAPCVIATTGYDAQEEKKIAELSKKLPVFKSANMSLGVNVLGLLVERAAALLSDFDVEILEKHHNQKSDAPSGTARELCSAVAKGTGRTPEFVYGREGNTGKRTKGEIGVHSVRGGSIVGEHEVLFCGADEVVTLSHSAGSRAIFADGALKAALWLLGKPAGLYCMRDLFGGEL